MSPVVPPSDSAHRTAASTYVPPAALEPLHILDVLELTGSQARAGAELAIHQSTVCRSLRLMQEQFHLDPCHATAICRHGHNPCLQLLRLAYREHRLMAGVLRIGTDPLHQELLQHSPAILRVPARFRPSRHWAALVACGLLDGAIVSSWCHGRILPIGQAPRWQGLCTLDLGALPLQLMADSRHSGRVLLPRRAVAPLLHEHVHNRQLIPEELPHTCPQLSDWLRHASDSGWALPLCTALLPQGWLAERRLRRLVSQAPLPQRLWLLLPQPIAQRRETGDLLRQLRAAITRAQG